MSRRDVAMIISLASIVAATVLECLGYIPRDQVLMAIGFGIVAVAFPKEV